MDKFSDACKLRAHHVHFQISWIPGLSGQPLEVLMTTTSNWILFNLLAVSINADYYFVQQFRSIFAFFTKANSLGSSVDYFRQRNRLG